MQSQDEWSAAQKDKELAHSSRAVHNNLNFYHGLLSAIKCRSQALQHRQQNEISLVKILNSKIF